MFRFCVTINLYIYINFLQKKKKKKKKRKSIPVIVQFLDDNFSEKDGMSHLTHPSPKGHFGWASLSLSLYISLSYRETEFTNSVLCYTALPSWPTTHLPPPPPLSSAPAGGGSAPSASKPLSPPSSGALWATWAPTYPSS